ncbi:uncharacterized protein MONOS_12920 [Monocercomonoides exilis]|uniref:uncharacterized protein n=1 Tax=Monocercomonoides exilis TaxID=2049356 RepID=UPI00355A2D6A|nr:hypothetical protein MONOS_12920 [Monocercomonoides exilis]|eukprot:MONOS_12920.1-p1 / transcript=MONOS_12920.1 / gene=MONOS_12920 / organism=Monocercomonoides_exilis_PA203 / gene_product=unspecified product / transcript_product=unspecified product / location=Mono_scaffold00753:328-531(-) / protein_length=68 / sequence_SO=supercontig / SO=protein_coding / is_pseudo=false
MIKSSFPCNITFATPPSPLPVFAILVKLMFSNITEEANTNGDMTNEQSAKLHPFNVQLPLVVVINEY